MCRVGQAFWRYTVSAHQVRANRLLVGVRHWRYVLAWPVLMLTCPVYSLAHWQVGVPDVISVPTVPIQQSNSTSDAVVQVNTPIVTWPLVGNLKRVGIEQQGLLDANGQSFSWANWPTSTLADQFTAGRVTEMIKGGVAGRISGERRLYVTSDVRQPILQPKNRFTPDPMVFPANRFHQSAISNDEWVKQLELMALPSLTPDGHTHLGVNLFSAPKLLFDTEQNGFIFHATSEGWLHVFDWATGNELFAIIRPALLPHWYRSRWYTDNRLSTITDPYMPSQTLFQLSKESRSTESSADGGRQLLLTNSYSGFGYVQYQVEQPQSISMRYEFPNTETGQQLSSSMFTGASLMPPLIIEYLQPHREHSEVTAVIMGTGMAFSGVANSRSTAQSTQTGGVVAVDAQNGSILWQWHPSSWSTASPPLRFVAKPTAVDNNQDGTVDAVMLVDLYGRLFHLELPTIASSATITARLIADLSEHRARFFHPPIITSPQASTPLASTILLTASDLTVSQDQQPTNYIYSLPWYQAFGTATSQPSSTANGTKAQSGWYELSDFVSYRAYVEQLDRLAASALPNEYYRPWYYALPRSSLVPTAGIYDGAHIVLPVSVKLTNHNRQQHQHWVLDLPVTPEAIRKSQTLTSISQAEYEPLFKLSGNQTAIGLQWQQSDPLSLQLCSVQGCTTGSAVEQCDTRWGCTLKRILLKVHRLERLSHWREVQ